MLDSFNRKITYLRISVTDKCNLRCRYCMPEEGVQNIPHSDVLRFEQIEQIVRTAAQLGISKLRLTGGEPLIKKNIEKLVKMLSNIDGINLLSITTNAIHLEKKAVILKDAGLTSVNISLDTLNPDKYAYITRGGDISNVLAGIKTAKLADLPVKINMVLIPGFNITEIPDMKEFCGRHGFEFQPINHYNLDKIKLNNYKYERPPRCHECNRIRLLCNGILKPCLHSDLEYKVDFNDIKTSIIKTIKAKPKNGTQCYTKQIVQIGG